MNTKIQKLKIDNIFVDIEDDLNVKEIFRIQDLDKNQNMIPTMNEKVETLEAGTKKCISAGYKRGFWL